MTPYRLRFCNTRTKEDMAKIAFFFESCMTPYRLRFCNTTKKIFRFVGFPISRA